MYLFPSHSPQIEEILLQMPATTENTLCFRGKYYMAVNLEPLLPISVLCKPIAKVNDYTGTLCKYETDMQSVVAVFL